MGYTELQVTTNFTFLRGASHPEEMVRQASLYGYESIAITDRNTFAGIVRALKAASLSLTILQKERSLSEVWFTP
jgi:error-prone DNA polymerase